jgi:hypothetical protein
VILGAVYQNAASTVTFLTFFNLKMNFVRQLEQHFRLGLGSTL